MTRFGRVRLFTVIALLAAAAVLLGWSLFARDGWQARELNSRTEAVPDQDHSAAVDNQASIGTIRERDPDAPEEDVPSGTQPGDAPREMGVLITDEDSQPIPELKLRVAHEPLWGWPESWAPPESSEFVTDQQGSLTLPAPSGESWYVESADERWQLRAEVPFAAGKQETLQARRVCTLFVTAMCDNGEPWVGQASVFVAGELQPRRVTFDGLSSVKLTKLPFADLEFAFHEWMLGVDEQSKRVSAADIEHNATLTLTLTINPDSTNGAIQVDFSSYPGRVKEIVITLPGSTVVTGGVAAPEGSSWTSRPLAPGAYVVRLSGTQSHDPSWVSREVVVERRQVAHVEYEPANPATVQVQILDDNSEGIGGAVLMQGKHSYISFDYIEEQFGALAKADRSGVATLGGLHEGELTLTVAALGYEPVTLSVSLQAGEYKVLSPVTLVRATGRIEVTLEGRKEKKNYSVMVMPPGGRAVATQRNVKGTEASFEGLPPGEYVVAALIGRGGKPASATVTITRESPVVTITLDVSTLEETPLD